MRVLFESPALWVVVGITLVIIALLATMYCFSKRRNFEDGPQKGEAANPRKVRRQNSFDNRR